MKLTESTIEDLAIERLKAIGYDYLHGGVIAPEGERPERSGYRDVILKRRLREAVRRINPAMSDDGLDAAVREVLRVGSPDLLADNEAFHRLLTEGVPVQTHVDGDERGGRVWLVDFDDPANNDFLVVNQFTVVGNHHTKRPDLVLFVNGLPLGVIELKNAVDQNATIRGAFQQIETYKATVPGLFVANAVCVISDGLDAKAGSISAGYSRYMAWKTADGKHEASATTGQLETLIAGMLTPATFLDLVRHFIVFEKGRREDPATGQVSITTVKKLAAYHQYYAVNAAVESTLRACGIGFQPVIEAESYGRQAGSLSHMRVAQTPESYKLPGVNHQPAGDRKAGVVWHTQGSGKSLSMVFYTGKIVLALDNPTVLVITDRNDLDDQLFDTFASAKQLLRQEPVQADNRQQLKNLLKVSAGGVVFSTIQKFQPDDEASVYEQLSDRQNIVVIADEAHRTQYGFAAETVDVKDDAGNITGQRIAYGFAKYLRDALPGATYLGFTGTPIEATDINTPAVFGNYVDIYDIAQAVEDGSTVRIYYESRLAKVALSDEGRELVRQLDDAIAGEGFTTETRSSRREENDTKVSVNSVSPWLNPRSNLSLSQKAKAKWTQMEALIGSENRIRNIAGDIVDHFEARQSVQAGKGMIVSMSRRIAAELYDEIIKLRPDWHDDDLAKGRIKVVMTAASSDGPLLAKHHTTKEQRKTLADRMKDDDDPLELVIVRDMWLTGFDAPSMHTLYIDKPMKGHNLMQAIARVNRVHKDKTGGLIVDYLGIASDLKEALSFYSDAGGEGDPTLAQEQAVEIMLEKIEVVSAMFHGFAYEDYFDADTSTKLSTILAAENHVLGLDEGKKRHIDAVTALSKAFAIAVPHDQAMGVKDEVGFFQAVKARLVKFESPGDGGSDVELETSIRQIIDQALVSEEVVDVFDAAGIKKPEISVLSEEFLEELRDHEHPNVALEVLKKLLNDELKARAKKNLVQSKALLEMLQSSIKRYQNKIITAAEVMDELIQVSKQIVAADSEAEAMGLTDFEYAFYTAVANNDSARELMQQDKLRELAVVLTKRVRENASIDWTVKESVRAKLKVLVKRLLRQYGYPPDMQLLAVETVMKQAELIAAELDN